MFDGSIGAGSVFMPHGGKYQLTETQSMVAKVPVQNGKTETVTMMSYGFDPYLSSWSPYHGAAYAVTESVAKIVATGGDYKKIRFTFQEYFRRMTEDPKRWSQPFSALLGAYAAQIGFGLPSIGGKDSMSGTFNDIDVPPTLVSFAVDVAKVKDVITPEFKKAGSKLVWLRAPKDSYDLPDYPALMEQYDKLHQDIQAGRVISAYALDRHGIVAAVSKMAFGNGMGVKIEHNLDPRDFFAPAFGDIICEVPDGKVGELAITYTVIGEVTDNAKFTYGDTEITLKEALSTWEGTLENVFKTAAGTEDVKADDGSLYKADSIYVCKHKVAKPRVFIPVFPGTNCEYDSTRAFERAGAEVDVKVFKNLTAEDIHDSVELFEKAIAQAQMIMFPGGFSAGDEPDGSAKFFATAFQNEKIKEAVMKLLNERDGLALGICNGFQALIKLGLVPYGEICGQKEDSPTLTYNTIGRHVSRMVYTKVVSNKSPWLQKAQLGGVYCNPASHGEGRFVANDEWLKKLKENGQIATEYVPVDETGYEGEFNVNGSGRMPWAMAAAAPAMKPSMTMGTRREAAPSISPAMAPISGPPTFASTSMASEGSGLFRAIPCSMSFIFLRMTSPLTPEPRPVTVSTGVPVSTATMAEEGVVLPMPISPAATMSSPLFFSSRAMSMPTCRHSRACSRVMAGPLLKSLAPCMTFLLTSPGRSPKS